MKAEQQRIIHMGWHQIDDEERDLIVEALYFAADEMRISDERRDQFNKLAERCQVVCDGSQDGAELGWIVFSESDR